MKHEFLFIIEKIIEVVEDETVEEVMVEDLFWFLSESQASNKRDELESRYKQHGNEYATYNVRKEKFSDKEE